VALGKSYQLLQALNRPRGGFVRTALGWGGYLGALGVTGSPMLARELRDELARGEIKDGMRLAHWMARRGWPGLTLFDDPMFQFQTTLTDPVRAALLRFARARARRDASAEAWLDVLDVLARNAHAALRRAHQADFELWLGEFEAEAAHVLELLARPQAPAAQNKTSGETGKFSLADADAALQDFAATMAGAERWFLISGTLLGVVREGGWLRHDVDIDVGIHAEACDFERLLGRLASTPQFTVAAVHHQEVISREACRYALQALPVMVKLVHRTGINLDVFIHHLDGDNRWHGSAMHRWGNSAFGLRRYSLAGMEVLGPADADRYLTENYGNWQVPVTAFNGTIDTPNLEVARNLMSVSLMLRKLAFVGGVSGAAGWKILDRLDEQGVIRKQGGGFCFNREFLDGPAAPT